MHIAEGFLPVEHAIGWAFASAPFVAAGLQSISKRVADEPESKMLLGVSGAFMFALSALKLPSVTGSSSHPTGTGLGAVMFGPLAMAPIALVVLLFQALLLAHGGITTLGANVFSLGVAGPGIAFVVWRLCRRIGVPLTVGAFLAASLGDLATYVVTSLQLAFAFPDPASGCAGSAVKFLGVFAVTQVPIAITEGILTAAIMKYVGVYDRGVLIRLGVLSDEVTS